MHTTEEVRAGCDIRALCLSVLSASREEYEHLCTKQIRSDLVSARWQALGSSHICGPVRNPVNRPRNCPAQILHSLSTSIHISFSSLTQP